MRVPLFYVDGCVCRHVRRDELKFINYHWSAGTVKMDNTMIKRLDYQVDIKSFHNFLRQKGMLPMSPKELVITFGEWHSLVLLCAYSAECKESHFDVKDILSTFSEAAKEIPIDKFQNIEITKVLVSNVYELHSLCLSLTENGQEELFRKVIKSIEKEWTNIENERDDVDSTEKQRRADLCIMALCVVSQIFKDQDELKISLKKTADHAKHFTTNPDEALALIQASELMRIAYGDFAIRDTKQKGFPEHLKRYTGEQHNLSTRGYILDSEIMFLMSDLRKFSNTLHQQIIEKLMVFGEVFGVKLENYHIENYRNSFLKKRFCMEALCRLGISFTLENFPDVKLNQEEMERVRHCLISITKPEVWKSISCQWRAMTYAALTKWFYLNSDSQNAEICAISLEALLPKFLIQGNDTVTQNAHILLQSITRDNKMQSWHLEPIKFETLPPEHPIRVQRFPDNVVVIQTKASNDIGGPYYQIPFQHILLVVEETDCGAFPDHIEKTVGKDIQLLLSRVAQLENTVDQEINALTLRRRITLLQETVQEQEQRIQSLVDRRAEQGPPVNEQDMTAIKTRCQALELKTGNFEGIVTTLHRDIERCITALENLERQSAANQEKLDEQEKRIRTAERAVSLKDVTISELEHKVKSLEVTSYYDGTLFWKIPKWSQFRRDATSGKVTSISSPHFFNGRPGYQMCAKLYPNGDGIGTNTHISIFFVVLRGFYDALLSWPFVHRVTFMLLDQNNRDHVIDSFRPDPSSSSFKRPTTYMNIASGCPLFMPLSKLDDANAAYVKDDVMFIKVIVESTDRRPGSTT